MLKKVKNCNNMDSEMEKISKEKILLLYLLILNFE